MKIPYAGWEVTSRCNLDCEFCYSFMFEKPEPPTSAQLKIGMTRLKALGLVALNFCGGEPLLRADLNELLDYAKTLSIETILSTNGDLLEKYIDNLEGCLDWIVLPLDGGVHEDHDYFRGTGSFSRFTEKIELVRKGLPNTAIKINTVVTARNIRSVSSIPTVLRTARTRLKWKIIQFSPRGRAQDHKNELSVSDHEFRLLTSRLAADNVDLDIDVSPNSDRDGGCVILDQRGDMLVPFGNSYSFLGNIFEIDIAEFLSRTLQECGFAPAKNQSLHQRSYRWTA